MEYQIQTIHNGLRVMYIPKPDTNSVVAMMGICVGSAFESNEQAGIAHFIEHNVFKGTKERPNRGQIAYEIESIGGVMDAGTSKEYTFYYAKAAPQFADRVLDVVLDISANMIFPLPDIEIERGNVLEEIRLMRDTPSRRLIYDFIKKAYGDHPYGREIAGTEETVSRLTREQMLSFVADGYATDTMLLVLSGSFDSEKMSSQIEQFYREHPISRECALSKEPYHESQKEFQLHTEQRDGEQTHISIGVKAFGKNDNRKYTLELLNAVLGEGMGSRLFRTVRDKLGLAYYVQSSEWLLSDAGLWFAQAGVDSTRSIDAIGAILSEMKSFLSSPIEQSEFIRAKESVKGRTLLGVETNDDRAMWYGFQALLDNEILSPSEYIDVIDAVTTEELTALAKELLVDDQLTVAVLGSSIDVTKIREVATLHNVV